MSTGIDENRSNNSRDIFLAREEIRRVYPESIVNDGMVAVQVLIGGKWKIWILWAMRSGEKMRFSEIKRGIYGINDVMLSQCLKDMIESGMILREQREDIPSRQTYRLTELGKEIIPALKELEQWGRTVGFSGENL